MNKTRPLASSARGGESSDDDLDVVHPSHDIIATYGVNGNIKKSLSDNKPTNNGNHTSTKHPSSSNAVPPASTSAAIKDTIIEKTPEHGGGGGSKIVVLKKTNRQFEIEYDSDSVANHKKRIAEKLHPDDESEDFGSFRQRSANNSMRRLSECPPGLELENHFRHVENQNKNKTTPIKSTSEPVDPVSRKAPTTPKKEKDSSRPTPIADVPPPATTTMTTAVAPKVVPADLPRSTSPPNVYQDTPPPSHIHASRERGLPTIPKEVPKSIPGVPPSLAATVAERRTSQMRSSSPGRSGSHTIPKFLLKHTGAHHGRHADSSSSSDEDEMAVSTEVRGKGRDSEDFSTAVRGSPVANQTDDAKNGGDDTAATTANAGTRRPPPPFTASGGSFPPASSSLAKKESSSNPNDNPNGADSNGRALSNDEAKRLIIAQKASHNKNKFRHFTMQDIQKYIEKHNNQLPERDLELLRQQFEFLVEQRLRDDVDYSIDHQSDDDEDWVGDFKENYIKQHAEMEAIISKQKPSRETVTSPVSGGLSSGSGYRNPFATPVPTRNGRSLSMLSSSSLARGESSPLIVTLTHTRRYAPKEWEEVSSVIRKNITALKSKENLGVKIKDKFKSSFTRRRDSSMASVSDTDPLEGSGTSTSQVGDGDNMSSTEVYTSSSATKQMYKRYPGYGTKLFGLVPTMLEAAEVQQLLENNSFRRDTESNGDGIDDSKSETGSISSTMSRKASKPTLFRRLSSRLSSGNLGKLFKRKDSFRSRPEGERPAEEHMYGFLSNDEVSASGRLSHKSHVTSKKTFRGRSKSTGSEVHATSTKSVHSEQTTKSAPVTVTAVKDQAHSTSTAPVSATTTTSLTSPPSMGSPSGPSKGRSQSLPSTPSTTLQRSGSVGNGLYKGTVPRPQPHLNGPPLKPRAPYSAAAAASVRERRIHNVACGDSFMYTHFDEKALEGIKVVQRKSTLIRSPVWESLSNE